MSDLANRIVDRMLGGGTDQIQTVAAQALWIHAVNSGVSQIPKAASENNLKTAEAINTLIAAATPSNDALITAMQDAQAAFLQVQVKVVNRISDMEQPKTSGFFM